MSPFSFGLCVGITVGMLVMYFIGKHAIRRAFEDFRKGDG